MDADSGHIDHFSWCHVVSFYRNEGKYAAYFVKISSLLLSGHILWKESIVIIIKFRLWKYWYIFCLLRFLESIIAIFTIISYVCMYACTLVLFTFYSTQSPILVCFRWCRYLCTICVSENDSAQIMFSIELPFDKYVTGHYHESCIHFRTNRTTGLVPKPLLNYFQLFGIQRKPISNSIIIIINFYNSIIQLNIFIVHIVFSRFHLMLIH